MTSEREAYDYIQLPGTLETVPAALLRVRTLADDTRALRRVMDCCTTDRKQREADDDAEE